MGKKDCGLGIGAIVLGIAVFVYFQGLPGAAGSYPKLVSAAIVILGILILFPVPVCGLCNPNVSDDVSHIGNTGIPELEGSDPNRSVDQHWFVSGIYTVIPCKIHGSVFLKSCEKGVERKCPVFSWDFRR